MDAESLLENAALNGTEVTPLFWLIILIPLTIILLTYLFDWTRGIVNFLKDIFDK